MANYKCKMCGGALDVCEGQRIIKCDFCGTTQTVPVFDDEKKQSYYNRANSLRLKNEFDKAAGFYELIVSEFPKEAEAYWGLILCKFGIEYVEDKNHIRIPTCHRTQYISIFDDSDYLSAIKYADVLSKDVYENEAKEIDAIQKQILRISYTESPFDIFICYKELDENGDRTEDSVIATDIYNSLTEKGYRVFFSRITLESKLGTNYEPYIFSALHSSKVLLHVTTSLKHTNSVWVKNEWSRYVKLMGDGKVIIPCYKGIKPSDLPSEIKNFQGQDFSKIGAMQDLLHGIDKILNYGINQDDEEISLDFDYSAEKHDYISEKYNETVADLLDIDSFCSFSSDVVPLIAFFENNIDYKDSKQYLIEAKYQFIKRISSYDDCEKALFYLKEIAGYKDVDTLEPICQQKKKKYKEQQLENIGVAIAVPYDNTLTNINAVMSGLLSAINIINDGNYDEFEQEIIRNNHEEIINYINLSFEKSNLSNADLRQLKQLKENLEEFYKKRIGILHYDEISKRVSIKIQELERIEKEKERKKRLKKLAIIAGSIISVIVIVLIITISLVNKNKGYSADNFDVSVISKVNDTYNENLADGYRGSGYYYTFTFVVENNSPNDITQLCGNMDVNNSQGKTLSSSTVTLNGTLKSKSNNKWTVQLNVYKGDNAREIWNTDFEYLEITFRITEITFADDTRKTYGDTKNKIVHSIDKSSKKENVDESNNNSTDVFGDMLNESLEDGSELLKWLHHDVGSGVLIPDEGYSYISYSNNCGCYSADYSKSYVGSSVFFIIEENYVDTLVFDFKRKLDVNGWTSIYDDGFSYEYKKGNIHIQFDNVRPSEVWNGYEYNLEYYYFNYSAYVE